MNYISLGGWCGTRIAINLCSSYNGPTLPFDYVKSSFSGVIDCIENDFINFFPKDNSVCNQFRPVWKFNVFMSDCVSFWHPDHDIREESVVESFKRKIKRFDETILKNNCIFLRTIMTDDYNSETKLRKNFHSIMERKYPSVSYVLIFIIPTENQSATKYYKPLDNKTFLFTLKRSKDPLKEAKENYDNVFDTIEKYDFLNNEFPEENNITVIPPLNSYSYVNNCPILNVNDNFCYNENKKEYTLFTKDYNSKKEWYNKVREIKSKNKIIEKSNNSITYVIV